MLRKSLQNPKTVDEEARDLQNAPSLRKRIVLAGVVVISVITLIAVNLVFNYSRSVADLSYDRLLRSALLQMEENVRLVRGQVTIDVPWSAFATLAQANDDRVFYKVESSTQGFITGYSDLDIPVALAQEYDQIHFYDQLYSGEKVRFAVLERELTEPDATGTVRILLGQTRLSRQAMASSITVRAVQVIVLMALVAISLIAIGSQLALRPLHRIEKALEERQPGDLTPLHIDTPKETHHLKVSINHFMARLQTNLEQLENYTAEAAHQLRTPLASLKALAENTRDQTHPEKQQQALEQMVTQADKLSKTVTQLLNQAVVSHRLQTQSMVMLDLVALLRQCCMEQAVVALRQGVELSFDGPEQPVWVKGDAFSLQQLFANLIENAVRYSLVSNTSENVPVRIEVSEQKEKTLVKIIDHGEGIADQDKPRVFERFYRARDDVPGSGVGLAMVKEIADFHHALVEIEDTHPHGATFRVTFGRQKRGKTC